MADRINYYGIELDGAVYRVDNGDIEGDGSRLDELQQWQEIYQDNLYGYSPDPLTTMVEALLKAFPKAKIVSYPTPLSGGLAEGCVN